ncbi:MAG: sulfite dehydrogenase [Gemmatimonadota bacterium]
MTRRRPRPVRRERATSRDVSRRDLLAGAAAALGGVAVATLPRAIAAAELTTPLVAGATSAVGQRSPFAQPKGRTPTGEITGNSLTPLQELNGTITPSDLHFERHHAGIPTIDPARHRLLLHGLVDQPLEFALEDLKRFPQVTRVYFVECSGNGRAAYRQPKPDMTPQKVEGLTANSEWTGVSLATLLNECGIKSDARWFLAEGADDCRMTRSIPIEKALDDALVVWGQNGEALRPEQGYPLRLLLPGWEGNTSVKWLQRIELGREPWMTRWETSKYTDPLPNGTARRFSFVMDAKSIITAPAFPSRLPAPGWYAISGLAWSGRGRITRVEVSTDNGRTWADAELQGPVLSKAHTRFQHMWQWRGDETVLLSRAVDETGYVQPTRTQLIEKRGIGTDFHFNPIRGWRVHRDGQITFHGET